jgi:hypothetical protein
VDVKKSQMKEIRKELMMVHFREIERERERITAVSSCYSAQHENGS